MNELRRSRARGGRRRGLSFAAALALGTALPAAAQSGTGGEPPPTPPADGRQQQLAPVQITGSRPDDVQERRQSTVAKIVIGRDEIDRFGDSTLGDVLKRLPGVTIQGAPGRGGQIRLRGLGEGYTQILLDGERVPPGFSLDLLTPDQIERIEILRAPTAETGARAIAGTINIVTRGGYTRNVNEVRLTTGYEHGNLQPSASWTRNLSSGPFIVNYSISAFTSKRDDRSTTTTVDRRQGDGTVTFAQSESERSDVRGEGVNATGRLQWRGESGVDSVTLTPILFHNRFRFGTDSRIVQSAGEAPYDRSSSDGRNSNTLARLNAEWTRRLSSGGRLEWRAGAMRSRLPVSNLRVESSGADTRTTLNTNESRTTQLRASGKLVETVFDTHSLVAGAEVESDRRDDTRTTLDDGVNQLPEFDNALRASATRWAAYAQDEWNLTPQWAAQAGLRWESIGTRGGVGDGRPDARNRSSVLTPLLHAVWRPDPKSRDQIRISLTRSYKSPALASLVARPSINARYPLDERNTPTQPDRAGNPDLKPELATGIDVAVERYLPGSGVLSANVFHRNVKDALRSVTTLEDVSYASAPRYVLRAQNVGDAVTQGIELEMKFRASDVFAGAPRIDLRANASAFRSRVEGVPGPDDRLDQQPDYTANVGADYRIPGWPLSLGGNLNWTPGYTTRLSEQQTASLGAKLVLDAYALWTLTPAVQLRLSLSNLDARDYTFGSAVDGPDAAGVPVRESAQTSSPSFVNARLRLEMKL